MRPAPTRRARQATAFMAACLLELFIGVVLVRAFRALASLPPAVLVFIGRGTVLIKPPPTRLYAPASSAGHPSLPAPPSTLPALLPQPSVSFPPVQQRPAPPIDWAGAAREAAGDAAAAVALTRERLAATGELPDERPPPAHHAAFPWSHQPLTSWFDFDPATLTSSLHLGRRCVLVFVLIVPGFGCLLGHLDDRSRGDLFDPALLPAPLQLPAPLNLPRQKPWSVAASP